MLRDDFVNHPGYDTSPFKDRLVPAGWFNDVAKSLNQGPVYADTYGVVADGTTDNLLAL